MALPAQPIINVVVQPAPFDGHAATDTLLAAIPDPALVGAVVTFSGRVRADAAAAAPRRRSTGEVSSIPQNVSGLFLEHYPGMTERVLEELAQTACARWPLAGCVVIHRHGALHVGEEIVFVATASSHRDAAFEAANYLMDILKTSAPFWKKELTADGGPGADMDSWVAAKQSDDTAADRWG